MTTVLDEVQSILRETFYPDYLKVIDESNKHVGHAGATSGKGHYRIHIRAASLTGKSRLIQHQLIYRALDWHLKTSIHALAICILD